MKVKTMMVAVAMALCFSIALSSCSTKMHAVNRLEKFSKELRDNSQYYTVDEWKKAGEEFLDIRKEIKKHELDYTAEQKKKIGVLEGKCAGYMAKGVKNGIVDKVKGFGNELNGILQGILNAITDFTDD
ncbi:MAG: hypothetical protein IKH99_10030 [Prevotella sp.]|nr:hypothetical protein [Prevotella sp.]